MAHIGHDVEVLATLASTLTASIEGYERAAEIAQGSALGGYLHRKARERSVISRRFRQRIAALGGRADSVDAAAHRRFLGLPDRFQEDSAQAVAEVERGEDDLAQRFESCLSDPELAAETKALLSGCYDRAKFDRAQWDALKEMAR